VKVGLAELYLEKLTSFHGNGMFAYKLVKVAVIVEVDVNVFEIVCVVDVG
jgi:hypothetical protein